MPLNKWTYIVIIVVAGVLGLGGLLAWEYHAGGDAAKLKQANATIKLTRTLKVRDAKIAKSVPVHGDDVAIDKFLLSHAGK